MWKSINFTSSVTVSTYIVSSFQYIISTVGIIIEEALGIISTYLWEGEYNYGSQILQCKSYLPLFDLV